MKNSLLVLALIFLGSAVSAQEPAAVVADSGIKKALSFIADHEAETIAEQIRTCEIAAPPFKEGERAKYIRQRFEALGLKNVRIDAIGNVIGERPGSDPTARVVLSAHLDTVFPEGTDVRVKRDGDILRGAGIADDCRGLAVIQAVSRALDAGTVKTRASIMFVADVGEEGLGNLRGVEHLVTKEMPGKIGAFVSVDGPENATFNPEIGSNRYKVTFIGPGGHSWGDFGLPSPIHALGRAINKIAGFSVPDQPRTTFNVGRIEGGTSVNSIAQNASFEIDMRSVGVGALATLDAKFKAAVQEALDEENKGRPAGKLLKVEVKLIGERPVSRQVMDAPIMKTIAKVDQAMGIKSEVTPGSSDSGMAVRHGIPAVTIGGGGKASGMHSPYEYFDTRNSHVGPQRALLVIVSLAGLAK